MSKSFLRCLLMYFVISTLPLSCMHVNMARMIVATAKIVNHAASTYDAYKNKQHLSHSRFTSPVTFHLAAPVSHAFGEVGQSPVIPQIEVSFTSSAPGNHAAMQQVQKIMLEHHASAPSAASTGPSIVEGICGAASLAGAIVTAGKVIAVGAAVGVTAYATVELWDTYVACPRGNCIFPGYRSTPEFNQIYAQTKNEYPNESSWSQLGRADKTYKKKKSLLKEMAAAVLVTAEAAQTVKGCGSTTPVVPTKPTGCGEAIPQTITTHINVPEVSVSQIHTHPIPTPKKIDTTAHPVEPVRKINDCVLQAEQQQQGLESKRYDGEKARNWSEFFRDCKVGRKYKHHFENTERQNPKDHTPIWRVIKDIPESEMFKKGNQFAPDRSHSGDHFEVWDARGRWIGVANLDGSKNQAKTLAEKNPVKRNLPR